MQTSRTVPVRPPRLDAPRRRAAWPLVAGAILLASGGCYPGDTPLSDVTVTLYDTSKSFKTSYRTFSLPDSVADIGDPGDPGYQPINHTYDALILGRVRQNLTAGGWVEIPESQVSGTNRPDVVVLVSALVSENTAVSGYPPYWGWWWGGWGGYYPPYWGYPCCWTVVQYTTGTLVIDMVEIVDSGDTSPVPWAARMNGVVNNANVTSTRLEKVIDQAFAQSPYLDIN